MNLIKGSRGGSCKLTGQGGLLDLSRDFYLIKERLWDWGSGDIYDERGTTIGRMRRKLISLRAEITIEEIDGTPIISVNRKIISLRPSYDIKDGGGNLLGRTRRKLLTIIRPKMWMEDATGDKSLVGQGAFAGWDFEIKDRLGRKIAEVSKTDRWRDIFLGGIFDYSDTYALHILDRSHDRRVLLGFVIAIDNSVHDK